MKTYDQLPSCTAINTLFRQTPDTPKLTPTAAKLLDMLMLDLTAQTLPESRAGKVTLSTDSYAQTCGYSSLEAALKQLRADAYLLTKIYFPNEENGDICPLLESRMQSSSALTVTFNKSVSQQILKCPRVPFPTALFTIDARKQNVYFLGRRLVGFGQAACVTDIGTLLDACPYIPSEDEFEGSRSILKRKVVEPFIASMDALRDAGILVWYPGNMDDSNYQTFAGSSIAFELLGHPYQRRPSSAAKQSTVHFDPSPFLKEGERLQKTITL